MSGNKNTGSNYHWHLFKSTDAGATWPTLIPVGNSGGYGTYAECLAIAPNNASILYVGGSYNYNVKILRSTDGGATWNDFTRSLLNHHAKYDYIWAIWVDPVDPNTVVVGTSKGIFHTANLGGSWNTTSVTNNTSDFAYNQVTDIIYAATDGGGVYKSEDRGVTWQAMNNGLTTLNANRIDVDTKNGYLFMGSDGASTWRTKILNPSLDADVTQISESTGGKGGFSLNAGTDNGGRSYLIFCSATGTSPGTPLPGGYVTLPLNWDIFTNLGILLVNTSMFQNFAGNLDVDGKASAVFDTFGPLPSGSAGMSTYFAFAINNPWDFASNPVVIEIVP